VPEAGTQLELAKPQLSVALKAKSTTVLVTPAATLLATLPEQVMWDRSVSLTMTLKLQANTPLVVAMTVLVPVWKNEPLSALSATGGQVWFRAGRPH